MLDKIKRLGADTAIYGISTIIGRFLNFLLVPFYTNVLPAGDYGIVATVFAYIAFLNVLYGYGMESAYLKYASTLEIGDAKQNFSTSLISLFFTASLFSFFLTSFSQPIAELIGISWHYSIIITYAAWILFFDTLAVVPFAALRLQNQAKKFASIKLMNILLNVVLNIILLVKFQMGIRGIFLSGLAASAMTFVMLLPSIAEQFRVDFEKNLYRELLRFGLPYIPAGLAGIAIQVIDRPILKALTDDSVVGIYQANYRLGIFMMLAVSMFDYAWRPFFLTQAREPNVKRLFARVTTYFLFFLMLIFLILSFFINDLVKINILGHYLIHPDYWRGLSIVPVILLSYVFTGLSVILVAGIYIEKRTRILPYTAGIGAVVNIVANFLLIPPLGMMGAAYATLLSYLAQAATLYLIVQKFYYVPYEFSRLGKLGLSTAVVFVMFLFLGGTNSSPFVLRIILVVGFPVLIFVMKFFEPNELTEMKRFWRKLSLSAE